MGRRELGMKKIKVERFDAGFFPNQDFDDVPDGGSPDCKHVIHRRSILRPFPGMNLINSSQAAFVNGQGLHYLNVRNGALRLAVFGEKLYSESGGTLTDITGTASITNGNLVQFVDHQQGSNQYAIGTSGGTVFRIGATGTASALSGAPSSGATVAKYHDLVFVSVNEIDYFCDTGDPTTWDTTNWAIPFEKNITCQLDHGSKLAVMMDDHIGSIQGYDYLDLFAEEKEIKNFGCVGKMAAKNCHWGSSRLKVIATISRNGVWIFDESFSANKILGDNYFDEFNQSQLSKCSMAYLEEENLLFMALPYAASTEPNYILIVNTKTGAYWPGPDIHANFVKSMASMRDVNNDEYIYYQDQNGFMFRFNFEANSYHTGTETQSIDFKYRTKRFDLEDVHSFGELNMIAGAVGNWGINVAVNFGLGQGDGTEGTITFADDHYLLGTTFVFGASTLGGSDYIFKTLSGVGGYGRHLQITLSPQDAEQFDVLGSTLILGESQLGAPGTFQLNKIELWLHRHRSGGDDQ